MWAATHAWLETNLGWQAPTEDYWSQVSVLFYTFIGLCAVHGAIHLGNRNIWGV